MDLRADDEAGGEGIVIDARMEKGMGVVADCVVRWGSVSKGDFVVSGTHGGRVKFLNDVGNKPLEKARPSQPVRIVGFSALPRAGDPIVCASSEQEAKDLIQQRESEINDDRAALPGGDVELQVMGTAAKQGMMMQKQREKYGYNDFAEEGGENAAESQKSEATRIPVVIKADSHGSLDAVRDALVSIGVESALDIIVDPVEMSTGVVTNGDVVMARESDAAIFTFGKVGVADKETKHLAEDAQVPIRNHDVIYRLLEDAQEYFRRYLPVELCEVVHGKGKVQAVFEVTDAKTKKNQSIAGLKVVDGQLFKEKYVSKGSSKGRGDGKGEDKPMPCFYRVLREGKTVIASGSTTAKLKANSLRKVKEDVDSVRRGEECGLGLKSYNDLREGDVVECFSIEEKRAVI